MLNPYQPPAERVAEIGPAGELTAHFQLNAKQIHYAESKFLLYRLGGRLTLASLVMIALTLFVSFDWPILRALHLLIRQLGVMLLATAVYLALIHRLRVRLRTNLAAKGVLPATMVTVTQTVRLLRWSTPGQTHEYPLVDLHCIRTAKGMVVVVSEDLFLFIPKRAEFNTSYREFFRRMTSPDSEKTNDF
ncbi:YcxB family protein [Stieleria sp. TO1_6]|uniref:YcxB family protein n=1 Tax=Stieleria tagensis TaxID=2956795 RepID=UPI00209ABABD|nr:YcxB family protein [Stieleria tagensis]MCO8123564.1 YcxB family protein [Stieleria tagensis]